MRKLRHQEIERLSHGQFLDTDKHPVSVLIDNIRSAHNVGSILRTADAARVEHVYLTGISPDTDHRMVHKTALGAQETVASSRCDDPPTLIAELKAKGYTIAALELTDSPTPITDIPESGFPMLLVVGNELTGVSEEMMAQCDVALEIQQYGTKQSLNVAVAFGIAIFGLVDRFRSFPTRTT